MFNIVKFILILYVIGLFSYLIIVVDKKETTGIIQSCQGIYETLDKMTTEATPQRLYLENAYFQLGCQKSLFTNNK